LNDKVYRVPENRAKNKLRAQKREREKEPG